MPSVLYGATMTFATSCTCRFSNNTKPVEQLWGLILLLSPCKSVHPRCSALRFLLLLKGFLEFFLIQTWWSEDLRHKFVVEKPKTKRQVVGWRLNTFRFLPDVCHRCRDLKLDSCETWLSWDLTLVKWRKQTLLTWIRCCFKGPKCSTVGSPCLYWL